MQYAVSKELENLGNEIIAKDRPELAVMKIQYMFRPTASVSNGRIVAGRCIKVDDRNWTIHGFDFLVEIAGDVWQEAAGEFRTAIMDHELGHIGIRKDENGDEVRDEETQRISAYIKLHDIEEFDEVLARHGAYHPALRQFLKKFQEHTEAAKKKKPQADEDRD